MASHQDSRELARLSASPPRRFVAVAVLAALGVLLVLLGLEAIRMGGAGAWAAQGGFLLAGAASLWMTLRLWQATARDLILTEDGLIDSTGRLLAPMERIVRVDRSVFAFKPSAGFLLVMDAPQPRAWQPGLWWRMGRRLGVGGVCNGGQARAMADILTIRLAQTGRLRD